MSELSVLELEAQHGELLPEREALGVMGTFGHSNFHTNGPFGHNNHLDNHFDNPHNSWGHGHH